jgi:hypothetical protein
MRGHLREWRDCTLGEVSVPLCPRGLFAVGEVERVYDVAAFASGCPVVGRVRVVGVIRGRCA